MKIAVLVDSQGKTSGFERDGVVKVYSRESGEWTVQRSAVYRIEDKSSARELRKCLQELCEWLADCKIVVVNRIRGVQYIALEECQISMLQIEGRPEEFLNDIQECEQHRRLEHKIPLEYVAISEQRPGCFYTDLRDVMNGKTSYSSKQILLPFFKENSFEVLEILCDHVPKWFDDELPALGLSFRTEQFKDCVKVKIYAKQS
jgi:Fe-only nitrogenase accessory protein AnfO